MIRQRGSLEERIAARQAERGPLPEGKHFEHGPAKFVFFGLLAIVAVTHLVALAMIQFGPG